MSIRKEIIGNSVLYHGDCRDILPVIGRVDAVITDPPFEKEAHRAIRRTQHSIKTGENVGLDFDAITETLRNDIAKWGTNNCDGWALYFCQAEAVSIWRDSIEDAMGKYKRACIWVKPDSSPQFNGQMPAQGYESIVCQWAGEGHSKWNGGGRRGVFTHNTNQPNREGTHPTEKPLPLMQELIGLFTNIDDTVLDPFMGSGTTGMACAKMGRKFIGIEIDDRYFELSCRRITAAYNQPDMFITAPEKIRQEAFI